MTKGEYFLYGHDFLNKCLEIAENKNADYTGGSYDPHFNYTRVESFGIKPEHGFITRMSDKLARIASYVNNGKLYVEDEGVENSLQDLANYCWQLAAYIKSKKESEDVKREEIDQAI